MEKIIFSWELKGLPNEQYMDNFFITIIISKRGKES